MKLQSLVALAESLQKTGNIDPHLVNNLKMLAVSMEDNKERDSAYIRWGKRIVERLNVDSMCYMNCYKEAA